MTSHALKWSALCVLFSPLFAGDGKIPIYQATTIVSSGQYQITRNFSVSGENGIVIQADDVTIDLGGFTITMTTAHTGISIADGYTGITIRNGKIRGGSEGIKYDTGTSSPISIKIKNLDILGTSTYGIYLSYSDFFDISECVIDALAPNVLSESGILANCTPTFSGGTLSNNLISGIGKWGINLYKAQNIKITHNQINRFSQNEVGASGLYVYGAPSLALLHSNNFIQGNTINGGDTCLGYGIKLVHIGMILCNNTVSGAGDHGFFGVDSFVKVLNNLAFRNGGDGFHFSGTCVLQENLSLSNSGDGISVDGGFVDGSTCQLNDGYGLHCMSTNDTYRNNNFQNNTQGDTYSGTDAGGNIP